MESTACRRRASDADQSARWSYSATAEREPAMVKEESEWGECGASEAAVADGLYAYHEIKDELVIGPELIQRQDVAFSIQMPVCRPEAPCRLRQEGCADVAPDCSHTCPGDRPPCNGSLKQQLGLKSCFVKLERLPVACCRRVSDVEQLVRWSYSATAECEPAIVKEDPEWGECGASEAAVAEGLYAGHAVKDELVIGPELIQQQDVAFSIQNTLNRMAVAPCKLKPAGGAGAAPERTPTRPGEGPRCNTSHEQQFELRGCSVRLERILMEHLPTCSTCLVIFHCKSSLQDHSCTHPIEEAKIGEDLALHHLKTGSERLLQYSSNDARAFTEETSCSDNISKQTHTGRKPFSCDICKSRFAFKRYLCGHMRIHTGEKPYSCDICKSRFSDKSHLNNHKRTHTGEKPFSCYICKSRFSYRNSLAVHKRTHTGEKPFSCDLCKSRFSHKSTLNAHTRSHRGEKPFTCEVCKSQFSQRGPLTLHRRIHTGEKPFSCDVCKLRFAQKTSLTSHKRTHTGEKPFPCDVCKLSFAQKSSLTTHKLTHTGEKPFCCDVCKSRFNRRSALIVHTKTHTDIKPFSCDICKSRFAFKGYLNKHMRTHTGENAYSCDICNSRFSRTSALNKHARTHTVA